MDGFISRALQDATKRQDNRLTEAALVHDSRSVEALESLLNGVPHPVIVKDRAHRYLLMNDAMCALMGRPRGELLGRSDYDFMPKEQADGYWAVDDEVLATGEEREVEEDFTSGDGKLHVFRTRKRPVTLPTAGGEETFLIASITDITQIRLAERALRQSEERHRYTVELSPLVAWSADADGMVVEVGARWYERTGMTLEQTLGTGFASALHPEDAAAAVATWRHSVTTGEPLSVECRYRLADGSYRWIHVRAAPLRGPGGQISQWYGTVEDIDDRKLAEQALRESEGFARSVLESSPSCIRVLDLTGHLLFMNEAGHRLLEIEDDSAIGRTWAATLPAEYAEEAERALASARAGHSSRFHAHRITRTGEVQWLDVIIAPILGADGCPTRLLSIWHDITDTKQAREVAEQAKQRAEEAAARLSSVLESTMDCVVMLDHEWRVAYMNQNASRLLAASGLQVGMNLWESFPAEAEGAFARHYSRAMAEQTPVSFEEFLPQLGIWLEVQAYPGTEGLSVFFRDITERRLAEEERRSAQEKISYMARHDALTGLPNRFSLRERLEQSTSSASSPTAVLCLDLDGFKAVNDTFGHPVGDALLQRVAERLQNSVRRSDLVARFGGDEFAIVQSDVTNQDQLETLARRIVDALSEPFNLDGQQIVIGTSIGIAVTSPEVNAADDLLKAADIALYCAKADGRGTFCFFDPSMNGRMLERQAIKIALRGALARREFELHYQPLIDLHTNQINSFEALLRWQHPERGMISPAEFIPLAEETGLIVQIGEWVLQEACRNAASWPGQIGIAVNLSPIQFKNKALVHTVREALAAAGLAPARLHLEITESVLLQDSQANIATLQDLRQLGVRIAMDDFGTGYSSLGYLRCFEFDKIKLDRSFVRDLPQAPECEAIARAVAGLASGLCIRTTAEGIETGDQLESLRASGYDEGQGYLFGKPVDAAGALLTIERFGLASSERT